MVILGGFIGGLHAEDHPLKTASPEEKTPASKIKTYDLKSFLEEVLAKSPLLESAILREQSAEYNTKAAVTSYYPKISARAQTGYVDGSSIDPLSLLTSGKAAKEAFPNVSGFVAGIGPQVSIPIYNEGSFLGLNTSPREKIAEAQSEQVSAQVALTRGDLRQQVIEVFIRAIQNNQKYSLLKREGNALEQMFEIADVKFKHQIISKEEFDLTKLQLDQSRQDMNFATWSAENSNSVIIKLLGVPPGREIRLAVDDIVPTMLPSYQVVLDHVLLSSPALNQQMGLVQEAKGNEALAQSKMYPTVTMQNSYLTSSDYSSNRSHQLLALVQVSVPVFDWGSNYDNTRAAQKNYEAQKAALLQTKIEVETNLHNAYEKVLTSKRAYLRDKFRCTQKEFVLRKDELLLKSGQVPIPDYLQTEIDYVDLSLQEQMDYMTLIMDLSELEKEANYDGSIPFFSLDKDSGGNK